MLLSWLLISEAYSGVPAKVTSQIKKVGGWEFGGGSWGYSSLPSHDSQLKEKAPDKSGAFLFKLEVPQVVLHRKDVVLDAV